MPTPKRTVGVVVVKPPPAPKTWAVDNMPLAPIRKTVAPAVAPEPKEPRPPTAVTPTPFMQDPGRVPGPTPGLEAKPVKSPPGIPGGHPGAQRVVPVEKKSPVGPNPSPTARRHANRHARFNRAITDPTLRAWAEGAKAAALAARTKYETDNPRPKSAATDAEIGAHGKRRNGS